MSSSLGDPVHQVREACAEPRHAELKSIWTQQNRLQKIAKIPVFIHLHRGYTRTWREIIPPGVLVSTDPLERDIELQLRQKTFRYQHIPDDEVLLPPIWLEPVHPVNRPPLWGVGLEHVDTHSPEGAYTSRPAVRDEVDFAQLRQPHYQVDEPATAALVERARELVDDALPVKLLTNE